MMRRNENKGLKLKVIEVESDSSFLKSDLTNSQRNQCSQFKNKRYDQNRSDSSLSNRSGRDINADVLNSRASPLLRPDSKSPIYSKLPSIIAKSMS